MIFKNFNLISILSLVVLLCCISCNDSKKDTDARLDSKEKPISPFSDPENTGGWVLNEELSDEFDGEKLDTSKWFIEGLDGHYYIWKGRPPSQFVPHNVNVEDGILKITSQWEPDYEFANEKYADGKNNDAYGILDGVPIPVTAGGIITKKRFLYGYMEVEAKVGYAAISGAFWAIGYEQELDIFELMGNPKKDGFIQGGDHFIGTVHDWSPPSVRPTQAFLHDEPLSFKTHEDFHVYAAEWGVDYLSFYVDGRRVRTFTQDEVGLDWVLNNPMEIWLDSEIFKRLGVPHKEELPVDFEVKYMRVWQKPSDNLLARDAAFYGFEGPILYEENPRPLDMVPEDSEPNDYQKFWLIDDGSSKYFAIIEGDYATGVNSLEFSGFGKNEKLEVENVVALTPEGAIDIPGGEYILSLKVWLDQGRPVERIYLSFENPKMVIPVEFDGLARREWVSIEKKITKSEDSSPTDQFKIEIRGEDVPKIKAAKFFIDDIEIRRVNK